MSTDLRQALNELMLAAIPFSRPKPYGVNKARPALRAAIAEAHAALRAPAPSPSPAPLVAPQGLDVTDAEQLVRAFYEAGGDWQTLVAAVNRGVLALGRRRAS
jgi:hypothetical protein